MFEKLKYRLKARNYFNPQKSLDVSMEDFLKILNGQVVNPIRLEDPGTRCGYCFMVVGVDEKSPLNSWAGRDWGANGYELAHENAKWYGKFNSEGMSRIIIPQKRVSVDFNQYLKSRQGKIYIETFDIAPWRTGGFMQADKDLFNRKTLVSHLSARDISQAIRQVYGNERSVQFDLLEGEKK